MGWYSEVSRDISKISDVIDHYETQLHEAKQDLKMHGSIEKIASDLPCIFEYRFNQLQEIEAILEHLNIEQKRLRSRYFKKYLESYQRALSSRDVEKYIDGESELVDFHHIVNEFSLLRNKWLGVMKSLDQKSFSINNIVKLRAAGMEDASI